jgi:aminoglycoside phosphotransferase (APT) family kinase protein
MLADVGDLLDDQARAGLDATLERYRGWSQRGVPEVLCHGDVHPGNVIQTAEGAMLIDWDLLCLASPGWDHGPLMTWTERWGGEPGVYEAFAAGYGHSLSDDPSALAVAELRLVAATLMRLRAGRTDPVAMAEAQRRLRWWRGDIDAPVWQAQ